MCVTIGKVYERSKFYKIHQFLSIKSANFLFVFVLQRENVHNWKRRPCKPCMLYFCFYSKYFNLINDVKTVWNIHSVETGTIQINFWSNEFFIWTWLTSIFTDVGNKHSLHFQFTHTNLHSTQNIRIFS